MSRTLKLWLVALLLLTANLTSPARAQDSEPKRLPTGLRLDPTGDPITLGSLPLAMLPAPGGEKLIVSLGGWREQGVQVVVLKTRRGEMPQLEIMHLPADHTAGALPGLCTPRACMADNDLALGRIVEALSHSPFWKDTVVFVLEDDAQAGPDHFDSHRSPLLVVSAYKRPGTVSRFANTTDVLAAIEDMLGMGRLSQFDYFSRPLADVFAATPDLTPYTAIKPAQSLDELNPPKGAGAEESKAFDLSAPDRVDDAAFNRVLWKMIKG
ncbi:MAG: alkaline phosphatase family protein, partial [Acidobacteria bacterium]|nr:alkaline phosphatase family protein [Acidobacteriota bacterium]